MAGFKKEILDFIRQKEVIGVRTGVDRTKFTKIWMVVVDKRVFGRSYYLSERSWYAGFLEFKKGNIQCGNAIVQVKGVKPKDLKTITTSVNKAYEQKYLVKAFNKKWVDGIKETERVARTMEFIPA
ncbi:MAG TPA: DUF2255 family protein [Puia sp.]|nr:DUF2255 family protein [Puia sp.]